VIHQYIEAAATGSNSVILTPADHVTGFNGIRVGKVSLINGVGNIFAVPWKSPIHLALEIEVTKALQSVVFGLGTTTLEGVPIFTVHNTDLGDPPLSLAPGVHQVNVRVDNPLRLGIYNLILGAHEAIAKTSIFYIPNAIRMEVIIPAHSKEPYFEHNPGIINGSSTWMVSDRVEATSVPAPQ